MLLPCRRIQRRRAHLQHMVEGQSFLWKVQGLGAPGLLSVNSFMHTAIPTQTVGQLSANLWENEAGSFSSMQIRGLALGTSERVAFLSLLSHSEQTIVFQSTLEGLIFL